MPTGTLPLRLPVVALIALLYAGATPVLAQEPAAGSVASDEQVTDAIPPEAGARFARLLEALGRFQQGFKADYRDALRALATPEVRDQFESMDEQVWPAFDPRVGWSHFATVSPFTVGGMLGETPLVAFYNPWADVFLVTQWTEIGEHPVLMDVEVLPGDLVRAPSGEIDPTPLWLRDDTFRPLALVESLTRSIDAFETLFPLDAVHRWRERLPDVVDAGGQVLSRSAAALSLVSNIVNLVNLMGGSEDDISHVRVRDKISAIQQLDERGLTRLLDEADDGLPAVRHVLEEAGPVVFRDTMVAAVIRAPESALAFLAPLDAPSGFLAVLLEIGDSGVMARRIDWVGYTGVYDLVKQTGSAQLPVRNEK